MKVVSLLPAATEIVCALGALESLAGVTHECDSPASVQSLPRVTRSMIDSQLSARDVDSLVRERAHDSEPLYQLDTQRISALRPDLIITQAVCDVCAVRDVDVRAVAASLQPAPDVLRLEARTLAGMFEDVARVGKALGASDEADELVAGLRLRLATIHATLRAAAAPRPRVVCIEWVDPIYTAGHWVPEMIYRAGGLDVAAAAGEHSRQRTASELRAAEPDVVLIVPCGYDLAEAEASARSLLSADDWAWAHGRTVWALDGNAFVSRPGPRLVRGVEIIARALHPGLFSGSSADRARRVT